MITPHETNTNLQWVTIHGVRMLKMKQAPKAQQLPTMLKSKEQPRKAKVEWRDRTPEQRAKYLAQQRHRKQASRRIIKSDWTPEIVESAKVLNRARNMVAGRRAALGKHNPKLLESMKQLAVVRARHFALVEELRVKIYGKATNETA